MPALIANTLFDTIHKTRKTAVIYRIIAIAIATAVLLLFLYIC